MGLVINGTFNIFPEACDEEYLIVEIDAMGTVQIKVTEEEGIVVDIFPLQNEGQSVASTWAHMNDLNPRIEE